MTVMEFCRCSTQVGELCAIREDGWIKTCAWIVYEDMFAIPDSIRNKEVKSDEWKVLPIVTEHGDTINIPCHYIDC